MAEPFRNTPEHRRWVRQKNRWLARLMFDGTLSPTARLVGFGIYKHLNDVSHDAWMAQETLRLKLGIGNIRTIRAAVSALFKAGYIAMTLDPKTRNYTYAPLLVPSDDGETRDGGQGQIAPTSPLGQGQIAPMGQGQSAPTIGAISPSPIGAISARGQGQIAPLSNINNYTKRSNDPTNGAHADALGILDGMLGRAGKQATEEDRGLTIEHDPIGDRWPIVQAAVVAKHGTRAKTYLDQLTLVGRVGDDVVLTAIGSFRRDLVQRDYGDTLTAAWRADIPEIKRVRIEVARQRAAQ